MPDRLRPAALALVAALLALAAGRAAAAGGEAHSAAPLALAAAAAAFRHRAMAELVLAAGFPLEEHFVETADGYLLGVYRIPRGRRSIRGLSRALAPASRPPVLLWHGLLDSSASWVLNAPAQSLGFLLADAGFDVWLANTRGNAFSRNHTRLDPARSAAFWDFSMDECAEFDLPAVAEHVAAATGRAAVPLVCHSQGCTLALMALATRPAMRRRLAALVALAPAAFLAHTTSIPLEILARLDADAVFAALGGREVLPARAATSELFSEVCAATPLLCVSALSAIAGFNPDNLNRTRLPTYVAYAPSGTSCRTVAHWAQAVRAEAGGPPALRQYSFGADCGTSTRPRACNQHAYGQLEAPAYDLDAIGAAVPIATFSGGRDRLAAPADVAALLRALPARALVLAREEPAFEHLDFTWGVSAAERVNPQVLELLRRYGGGGAGGALRQGGGSGAAAAAAA
jgi:pimeloyl-ACP methyl ester carboxylesterase